MKQISLKKFAIAASAFACAALLSVGWSEQGGVSLSVNKAEAYAQLSSGRLTPRGPSMSTRPVSLGTP